MYIAILHLSVVFVCLTIKYTNSLDIIMLVYHTLYFRRSPLCVCCLLLCQMVPLRNINHQCNSTQFCVKHFTFFSQTPARLPTPTPGIHTNCDTYYTYTRRSTLQCRLNCIISIYIYVRDSLRDNRDMFKYIHCVKTTFFSAHRLVLYIREHSCQVKKTEVIRLWRCLPKMCKYMHIFTGGVNNDHTSM